ncbi:MAG: hypothetical protein M3036_01735 [Bifidobacteriales bacterium]|nr:hypothetical protein [Bifidobacteriales bacterium]
MKERRAAGKIGWMGSDAAYAGVVCQYDPECPVHRHRPGTTCPVVYRKQRAAIRARQQRKAMWFSIFVNTIIVVLVIVSITHPEWIDAIGDWLAWLWPSLFGPNAGQSH